MATSLAELGLTARGGAEAQITGLAVDSRKVEPGFLFAALPGSNVHGGEFIQYALRMEAGAVLTDPQGAAIAAEVLAGSPAALIVVEDPRAALAQAAALYFGRQPEVTVAVTGTNGKTSVTNFCRQIWQALDLAAINLGTTGIEGDWHFPLAHTTPEPITLHHALADAAALGITHCAMEASSHGLDQRRLDGVALQAAAFTNFTQDHLDYHGTFEAYFDAKLRLFTQVLPESGVVALNMDDPKVAEVAKIAKTRGMRVIRVGKAEGNEIQLLHARFDATGQDVRFMHAGLAHQTRLNLIGGFQAENVLLAAALVMAGGEAASDVFAALPRLEGVRGRMQWAATRANGAAVFVDYAHTPDAIETALTALRPHVMGRLVAIIGAGGDRDTGKRPLMGQAAATHADHVIVTDDNPRSEDPAAIRAAVLQGCYMVNDEAIEVGDRAEAILRGVDALGSGDALLICGKGHEAGQVVGDTTYPFDDVEQASVAVAALDGALS